MTIRVTVLDTESGDTETQDIDNDYIVTCAGRRYVDHVQAFANGTHVVTIKLDSAREDTER